MKENRLNRDDIVEHFNKIKNSNLLDRVDYAFVLLDYNILKNRTQISKNAFPDNFSHCVAIKSNPLSNVLIKINELEMGFECASYEEVLHANKINAKSLKIWDSPAKTIEELESAQEISNLIINANDLLELKKVLNSGTSHSIGLRINPLTSGTSHQTMNVSSAHSKFGEPLSSREEIIKAIVNGPENLNGLHVHASSQSTNLTTQISAIKSVVELALEINSRQENRIKFIDIGGGFPVSYDSKIDFHLADFANQLRVGCPVLFTDIFHVITEFGRYYHGNAGFAFSKIENVKQFENHQTIIHHLGADFFLRESYNQGQWPHELFIIDGLIQKSGNKLNSDIGGPLCFGGDYLNKGISLPEAGENDILVICDVGANTFSLWSRHCSRPFPKVISHENGDYRIVKHKESTESLLNFWY